VVKDKYRPALEATGIKYAKYIYNIDEKGARIACSSRQDVIILIGIKEIYVGIPENRISLTIIKSISANGKAIPLVVIIPGTMIIGKWFNKKITGYKVITVSLTSYTNEGICMAWLDYFIKHHNYSPNSL
jgi:hypothetical protein